VEPILHAASSLSAIAAGNLISAIWQGTILAAAVALCLRLIPRLSAAWRSLVWLNVFLLLAVLHVLPDIKTALAGSIDPVHAPLNAQFHLDLRWSYAIGGLWAVLSLWRAGQLLLSAVRLHRLARRAVPMTVDPEIDVLLRGAKRPAEICTSDEVARPSVFGFFHPRILLPLGLTEKLSISELRQVVMHELEHLRRADDWTNLLQKIALVLFPLNPVLLWVERRLCAERELACDDHVLAAGGAGKAYAICLTRLAEHSMLRRSLSLVLGAWERRPELARRVHRLLKRPHAAMGGLQAKMVTAALLGAVMGGGYELARSPQLVGFVKTAPAVLSASMHPAFAFDQLVANRMEGGREGTRAPHMVEAKAVISAEPANGPAHEPVHELAHKAVLKHTARRHAAPQQANDNGWMVLTEWTDVSLPPHAVLAVKFDPRGSYAAVPVRGGWLIVQI
jgi:beta-lactamase regulating signal transducer with metallopeptidase domain